MYRLQLMGLLHMIKCDNVPVLALPVVEWIQPSASNIDPI